VVWCEVEKQSDGLKLWVWGQNNKQEMKSPHSADTYLCDFYLLGMLRDKEYSNNPCTKDDLKETIQNIEFSISQAAL
jgi:hypothetical protein